VTYNKLAQTIFPVKETDMCIAIVIYCMLFSIVISSSWYLVTTWTVQNFANSCLTREPAQQLNNSMGWKILLPKMLLTTGVFCVTLALLCVYILL